MSYRDFINRAWFRRGEGSGTPAAATTPAAASAAPANSSHKSRRLKLTPNRTCSSGLLLLRWLVSLAALCLMAKLLILSKVEDEESEYADYDELDDCPERMGARLRLVREVCASDPTASALRAAGRGPESHYPDPQFFRSNVEHSATVCTPHKCGSESWRYFFERLDERDRNSTEWRSAILSDWPEGVEHFVKAFQVRHPLERVLSAYRYVFEQTTLYLTDDLSLRILEKYAGYEFDREVKGKIFPNRTVTFREFVWFLTHPDDFEEIVTKKSASSHWRPFHLQCNPCHPDFRPDFLIHLETAEEDTECFLRAVPGITDEDYNLYVVNSHPKGQSSEARIKAEYYSTLTKKEVADLERVYKLDFLMHGYDSQEYLDLAREDADDDDEEHKEMNEI